MTRVETAMSPQPLSFSRSGVLHDDSVPDNLSEETNMRTVGNSSNMNGGLPTMNNSLHPLQEDEQEVQEGETKQPHGAQQPLSPPALAACATTASSGSSSSGRRRFGGPPRLRSTVSNGSPSPPAFGAAAAACLPRDDNLYASLVRYQEEHDDSTTVSMGDTLRSVSTWYSVQSDDDRKIPARPLEGGGYDGSALRRPFRAMARGNNISNIHTALNLNAAGAPTFTRSSSNNSISSGGNTPAQGNSFARIGAAAAGARYPPPAATRRTSSGSMSRSVASGPPPVVWEEEKDDYTAISSLANQTVDRSDEGSVLNSLPRYPLGVLDEGCAVGGGNISSSNNNNRDFACLSSAAQLTQESSMGNMVETTRSAPTPYGGSSGTPGNSRADWEPMNWTFPNNLGSNMEEDGHRPSPPVGRVGNRNTVNRSPPPNNSNSAAPSPPPPAPMNDFTRMQHTLGMQDLCVPGSTNHSVVSESAASRSLASTVESSSVIPSANSKDPAADEQYRIWKQIQEEQERKQMELALQLSQQQSGPREVEIDDFEYPDQDAKPPEEELDEEEALKVALRLSQEEAAASEAVWRHGSNASGGNGVGSGSDEEDEIALALRLSKEQAEADQKRFQQMQQDELSEEEQLRLAMEQSMANSSHRRGTARSSASTTLPQHNEAIEEDDEDDEEMRRALAESLQRSDRTETPDDGNDDDDDMALALRLSQVQMEEEERFRQSFLQSSAEAEEEDAMASNTFSNIMRSFPGEPPLNRSISNRRGQPGLDDGDYEPPVRSRPSQEPPSPGLHPHGQMSNTGRGRMMQGGRLNGTGPMGLPSVQDLESSQHARDKFSQQHSSNGGQPRHFMGSQHSKVPSKVHRPDDGDDMRPASRPQRKDQKPATKPCNGEINVVDIDKHSRDVLVREGQSETRAAILQGQSQIVTCRGCFGKLHAPVNCALVFCPTCNTVSQVTGAD